MEVLSYELSPIPCSLAHQDGSLRKNTKSHLAGIIEKLVTVVPQLQPSPENTVYILDGMTVIQMIKSGRTATFGELAKHYFKTFRNSQEKAMECVYPKRSSPGKPYYPRTTARGR